MPTVLKSGSLNFLESSGPVQACNGIALPLVEDYLKESWPNEMLNPLGKQRAKITIFLTNSPALVE